jgi:hypothetical protein
MGQLSLYLVLATFLVSGAVLYNSSRSVDRTEEKVWEHQFRVLAQDAAGTGMAATAKKLGEAVNNVGGFTSHSDYPFTATNVPYESGTYSVQTFHNQCSVLSASNIANVVSDFGPISEWIEIRSTGEYTSTVNNSSTHRHQLRGCYIRADWGQFAPPAFNYGFISDQNATFNGGTIESFVDGYGHVHANGNMTIRPQTVINGHVTYTGDDNVHQNATVASHGSGPAVPMTEFSASEFALANGIPGACADANVCRHDSGFSAGSNMTIAPPGGGTREDNPFIWYIDGDFALTGTTHITVPQFTVIVVTGNVSISGSASLTVTGTNAPNCNNCSEQQREWVESQLIDGETVPIAWYGEGNVTINGSGSVVGNFYVNGDVTLNGGGTGMNTVGSFAALGGMTVNGGAGATRTNFWFIEVAEQNVIPGVALPGKQIVRVALAEWTEPVLANE